MMLSNMWKSEHCENQHLYSSDIWPLPRRVPGNGKLQVWCRLHHSGTLAGKQPDSRGSRDRSCPSKCLPRTQARSRCYRQAVHSQAYKLPTHFRLALTRSHCPVCSPCIQTQDDTLVSDYLQERVEVVRSLISFPILPFCSDGKKIPPENVP